MNIRYRGIHINVFIFSFLIIFFSSNKIYSNDIFSISEVKTILSNNTELQGDINNIKIAPFNNDIISFELKKSKRETVIYLYNISTKNLSKLNSIEYAYKKKRKLRYLVKEFDVEWHPSNNSFVYVSNAFKNRNKLYVCKILNNNLATKYSIHGYLIKLDEDKDEKSRCKSPSFDVTGNELVFSRRSLFYKSSMYDICLISNFNKSLKNNDYKDIAFETIVKKKYNQINPVFSPSFSNRLVAYNSFNNRKKKNQKKYTAKYNIEIIDLDTRVVYVLDEMEGFKSYPFIWSEEGKKLLYNKAKARLLVKQELINSGIDQVTLRIAEVRKVANKIFIMPISSNNGFSIILDDISGKKGDIAFFDENIVVSTKYNSDNSKGLVIIDLKKWRNGDKDYFQLLDIDLDAFNPIIANEGDLLSYIEYNYSRDTYSINQLTFTMKVEDNQISDVIVLGEKESSDNFVEDYEDDEELLLDDEEMILDDENISSNDYEKKIEEKETKSDDITSKIEKNETPILAPILSVEASNKEEKMESKEFDIKDFNSALNEIFVDKEYNLLTEIIDILEKKYKFKNININKNIFYSFREMNVEKKNIDEDIFYYIKANLKSVDTTPIIKEVVTVKDDVKKEDKVEAIEDEYSDEEDDEYSDEDEDETEIDVKKKDKTIKRSRRE